MSEYITIRDLVSYTSGTSLSDRRLQQRVKTLSEDYDFIKKVSNVWRIHKDHMYKIMGLLLKRDRNIKRMRYNIKDYKTDDQQLNTEIYLNKLKTIDTLILKNDFDGFITFQYKRHYSVDQIYNEITNITERLRKRGFDFDVIYSIESKDDKNHYHLLIKNYKKDHRINIKHKDQDNEVYHSEYSLLSYIQYLLEKKGDVLIKDWDRKYNRLTHKKWGISYILKQYNVIDPKMINIKQNFTFDITRFGVV